MTSIRKIVPLEYRALEKIRVDRPVDRLAFMAEQVQGKLVFDLGALDETAVDAKRETPHWLHARLCERARQVIGIDNSSLLPADGVSTVNGGRIIHADIFDLSPLVAKFGVPEVIVSGELIEHLPDTEAFLRSLRANSALRGCLFVFSTPNACCWHNILVGVAGRESMHKDHLQVYSYKTLQTLFCRSGLELLRLVPCHARFHEMINDTHGATRLGVRSFQRVVNGLEWMTPMLSAGWVGLARI